MTGAAAAGAACVTGADAAPLDTTDIGGSERAVCLGALPGAGVPGLVTTHLGGGSERAACLNSGATIDGGVDSEGFERDACERTLAVVSGAVGVVVIVGEVRCFVVTRGAGSERTANAVAEGWAVLAEGS